MPQLTMDTIRGIIEDLLAQKRAKETTLADLQEIARKKIDHALIQKILRQDYKEEQNDGILSISLSCLSTELQEPLAYASGTRNPLKNKEEVTTETLYNLASVSKFILMVMTLRLIQAKLLSFDNTLSQLLPGEEIPNSEKIRVTDLLAHRSGLRDTGFLDFKESDSIAKILKIPEEQSHLGMSLLGSFYYAKINYILIAKIIQKVTKKSLQDSFKDLIGTPLKLKGILAIDQNSESLNHAVGYKPDLFKIELRDASDSYIYGSSGFRGTPSDLVKLIFNFFKNDNFICSRYRELVLSSVKDETFEFVTKHNTYHWPIRTGWGIEERSQSVNDKTTLKIYCHGGWQDSNATFLVFSPEDGAAYCCCVSKTQGLERIYNHNMEVMSFEGRTFHLPQMGLGCSSLTRASSAIVDQAIMKGIYSFDTADCYQNGESELALGERLKIHPRNQVFIASKVGVRFKGEEAHLCGEPDYLKTACAASLRRLQTSYLDLCYLHRVDPKVPIERSVAALSELVKQGKIRFIGLSEVTADQIRRANKIHPVSAVQIEYSPWSRHDESSGVIEVCRSLGIALVAYSPLGRGFFTQKDLEFFNKLPPRDYRLFLPRYTGDNLKHNYELRKKIQNLALKKSCTLAQLVLAWELKKGFVLIPATNNYEHLKENIAALKVSLNGDDMNTFDELLESARFLGPRYPNERVSAIYPETANSGCIEAGALIAGLGLLVAASGFFAYKKYAKKEKLELELKQSVSAATQVPPVTRPPFFLRSRL